MTDTKDDLDTTDEHVGFFIVPAEHLDELHALEAAAYEAQLRCYEEKQPQRPDWMNYRENQVFERAREVATAATVIEDEMYVDAYGIVADWVLRRFHHGDEGEVLSPDELAAMARELPGIRIEDVLRWARDSQRMITRRMEPHFIELFELLVRMVAAAADSPSGLALLTLHTKFRHPPDLPPPEPLPPEPEPEPVDEDEGALMGWFTVPAEHIPALQAIDAERDAAFRQERMADFYALETRLFERARAVARIADVFNAWAYKAAYRAWMGRLAPGKGPAVPAVRDAEKRESWAYWAERPRGIPDLPPGMDNPGDDTSRQDRTRARELSEAMRRAANSRLAKDCGLVIAWCFEKPPTWPCYDDASRRAAWSRIRELLAQRKQAEVALRAITTAMQRRARARAKDTVRDTTPAMDRGTARDAWPDAARAALDEAADQTTIQAQSEAQADLARRFPWLSRLPDREHVLATLARHIARAQPARVPIALAALLAEGFFAGDTRVERAGPQAMAEALAQHPAWVELVLPRRGKPEVRVYLDGQRLQVHEGGVSADAFFARRGGALLDLQAAWHQGVIDACDDTLEALRRTHRYLSSLLFQERINKMASDALMRRLDREERREARQARAQRR